MVHMRWSSLDLIGTIWVQGFTMEEGERRGSYRYIGHWRKAEEQHTHRLCDILASRDSLQGKNWFQSNELNEDIYQMNEWMKANRLKKMFHVMSLSQCAPIPWTCCVGSKWFLTFWQLVTVPIHKFHDCNLFFLVKQPKDQNYTVVTKVQRRIFLLRNVASFKGEGKNKQRN